MTPNRRVHPIIPNVPAGPNAPPAPPAPPVPFRNDFDTVTDASDEQRQVEQTLPWRPCTRHLQTFDAKEIFLSMLSTYHDNVLEEFDPRAFHALLNDVSTPTH